MTNEEIGALIRARFALQAEINRAAGEVLRNEIAAAMALRAAQGRSVTAKQVLRLLKRIPLPSVRTVQEHMKAVREKPPN